ncbi:MAG: sulfatase [Candidatus Cryptobacteroides sp.]
MNISEYKRGALLAIASLSAVPALASGQPDSRPNIVMFLIDDLGWNDFGCYGSEFYLTPALDSLAEAGAKFTDGYASCTVSSPTRAALMTGKYPARLHLTDWISGQNFKWAKLKVPDWTKYLPTEELTIAEYLRAAGYDTWHIGKWHLGDDPKYWPENQGFDLNIAGNFKGSPNKSGIYGGYFSPYGLERIEDGPEGEYLTDRLTEEAVRLIDKAGDRPFYLNMSHYAVHSPHAAPEADVMKYEARVDENYPQTNAVYAAMVESVDRSLSRIVKALRDNGKLDNTLIIVTSDNGSLERVSPSLVLRGGKGTEYEGGVRVPLLMYWQDRIPSGVTISGQAITMDLFSTMLDAAGVSPVTDVDGRSLLPLFGGKKLSRRPLFWHYPHYHNSGGTPYTAVRYGDWKLIHRYENDEYELYDLGKDPAESVNLVDAKPSVKRKLAAMMDSWLKDNDAQFASPNPLWDPQKEKKKAPYEGK